MGVMFFDTSLDPPFTIYFRGPPHHFFVAIPQKRVGNLREFLFDIDLFWVSLDSEERLAYSLHATIWSRLVRVCSLQAVCYPHWKETKGRPATR